VVREYRIDLGSLLDMPKRHFMWLYAMMPRVRADQSLSLLRALIASQSTEEGLKAAVQDWESERGLVYHGVQPAPMTLRFDDDTTLDPEFDREGLRALKIKHGA
jgi:hypothetical protein